jgi:hypothetical protein
MREQTKGRGRWIVLSSLWIIEDMTRCLLSTISVVLRRGCDKTKRIYHQRERNVREWNFTTAEQVGKGKLGGDSANHAGIYRNLADGKTLLRRQRGPYCLRAPLTRKKQISWFGV